jgi:DNA topoisomerase VI subunit B
MHGMCVCSQEISRSTLNRIQGLEDQDRLDEELYHDFESEEAKKVPA